MLTFEEIVAIAPEEIKDFLLKCADIPQSPDWHPEGSNEKVPHNVLVHIKIVYDRARKTEDFDIAIASLFHDLGKVEVTKPSKNKEGSWSAHGHEKISVELVDKHKEWIEFIGGNSIKVREIVFHHMRIKRMCEMRPYKREILCQNKFYKEIVQFGDCDSMITDEELNF